MSDTLRALIGAVQLAHMPDDYQRDMGECPCGFKYQKWSELASHVADAVIAALKDDYVIVDTRGCQDPWHQATGEPYQCPKCNQWMGQSDED